MNPLVCFDTSAGVFRRYIRRAWGSNARSVCCTNVAKIGGWEKMPPHERTVPLRDLEMFRLLGSVVQYASVEPGDLPTPPLSAA